MPPPESRRRAGHDSPKAEFFPLFWLTFLDKNASIKIGELLTKESRVRIAAAIITAIVLLLVALVLILDRFPELQQSRWVVALGIFASITSPIAVYEFLIKRFINQGGINGKSGQTEIINGQALEIKGNQQGTVTQHDQRGQTVQGPQTIIAGGVQGPVFSGQFVIQGDFIYNEVTKVRLPFQRPPRVPHFTGREAELAALLKDLQPGRAVTICGPGGMGKTALSAEAIWQLAPGSEPPQRFPDGIIFHTFYHKPQAALALETFALAYGEDPRQSPLDAAKRALAGRRALIVLDGAEACDDLPIVLSVTGSSGVLITTRHRGDAPEDLCDLPPLPEDKAIELLQAWGKEMASDDGICRSICALLGLRFSPLAFQPASHSFQQIWKATNVFPVPVAMVNRTRFLPCKIDSID